MSLYGDIIPNEMMENPEPPEVTREDYDTVVRYSIGRAQWVELHKPRVRFGEARPVEINWSAVGSVSIEEAKMMLAMLQAAIDDAEKMI